MLAPPRNPDIDHRTLKLIVGLFALTLANFTSFLSGRTIESISASYYEEGAAHVVFIGFLFAIAAFLLAYNGYTRAQMVASKIAAISTLIVVFVPCECRGLGDKGAIHGAAAAVTFGILAFFCWVFFQRAIGKATGPAKTRASIYAICGVVIVLVILVLGADHLLFDDALQGKFARLTYYGEKIALIAFGISWLTASHYLPVLTTKQERIARQQHLEAPV